MRQNVDEHNAGETLDNVLAAILRQADAGAGVNREEWLARYPQFAESLAAFFADEERVGRWTAPLRQAAASTRAQAETVGVESTAASAPVRKSFGDYEILEEIGQGGMGIVYRARQQRLNRLVALKMVRAGEFASEADRLRFLNEAELVGQMDHPNIVPIYEVGETQGQHFFSMKLVEGPSLASWITDCRSRMADLSIDRQKGIAQLIVTVARAINHAHQRGILHRDLKPANILMAPLPIEDCRLKIEENAATSSQSVISNLQSAIPLVTDFGLAKRVEETPAAAGTSPRERITQAGAIVGTPGYMAPEQAGAGKALSTAVDTYSLGAILYELLTGQPPFHAATTLDTLLAVLNDEPVRPGKINPRIDGDLETICLKCLEKDPQRRYGSAEELARDLERWLGSEPIHARRAGSLERLAKWSRRRPAAAAVVGISVISVTFLLTLAGFLWQNTAARAAAVSSLDDANAKIALADEELQQKADDVRHKSNELERLRKRAAEESTRAELARERADGILYDADIQFAHAAWQNDDVAGMMRLLDVHQPKAGQKDRRGFEWRYLRRLTQGDGFIIRAHANKGRPLAPPLDRVVGDIQSATFRPVLMALSPNGQILASTGGDQQIRLWDADTGKLIRAFERPKEAVSLGFAADGNGLILVTLRPLAKGQLPFQNFQEALTGKASLKGLSAGLMMHSFSLEGKELAKPAAFDPVRVGRNTSTAGVTAMVHMMAAAQGMVNMVNAMIPLGGGQLFAPLCLSLAPDKKTVAMGGIVTTIPTPDAARAGMIQQNGAIVLWDLVTGRTKNVFKGESSMVSAVAFSPDGRTLASAAFDRAVKVWDTSTYKRRATLKGLATPAFTLAFSGKGTHVFAGAMDGGIKMWDLENIETPVSFKGHRNTVSSLCIAADNRGVIAGCMDGTIRRWDARKLPPRQFDIDVLDLAFTADGKRVVGLDRDGNLKRFDLSSDKEEKSTIPLPAGLRPFAAFSPDGKTVAVIDRNQSFVTAFDVPSGRQRFRVRVRMLLSAVCLSPDGNTLALGCSDQKIVWQIQLWNLRTEKLDRTLAGGGGMVKCLAFAPDGKLLACGGADGRVHLWDLTTRKPPATMAGSSATTNLVFAPAGKHIAVAEGGTVRLFDLATKKELLTLPGTLKVMSMSFSPDERRLATGGGDEELGRGFGVKLWDLTTGREVLALAGPTQAVPQVAFSPDGQRIAATIASDATSGPIFRITRPAEVRIWNAWP